MSFPTKDTIFGTIIYKDKQYDLLTNPIYKLLYQKITKYKKEIEHMNNGKVKMQRDILRLKFSNGVLIDIIKKTEEYKTLNLEYYIKSEL